MTMTDVRQKKEHDKLKDAVKKLEKQVAAELLKNPVFKSMKERKLARSQFFAMLDNLMDAIGELEMFDDKGGN